MAYNGSAILVRAVSTGMLFKRIENMKQSIKHMNAEFIKLQELFINHTKLFDDFVKHNETSSTETSSTETSSIETSSTCRITRSVKAAKIKKVASTQSTPPNEVTVIDNISMNYNDNNKNKNKNKNNSNNIDKGKAKTKSNDKNIVINDDNSNSNNNNNNNNNNNDNNNNNNNINNNNNNNDNNSDNVNANNNRITKANRNCKLLVVKPLKAIFLSRLHPSTTSEDIISHIKESTCSDLLFECISLKGRHQTRVASFKLIVPDELFDILLSSDFWPPGIVIHEFVQRPRHNNNNNNNKNSVQKNPKSSRSTTRT